MARRLKPGDKVRWNTSQGETQGKVIKRTTQAGKIKTHRIAASKTNPEYVVESARSGKRAAHKRRALKKA